MRHSDHPYNHISDMVIHMKTTFNIDDSLMQQLRIEAARRNTTMTSIVEAGIQPHDLLTVMRKQRDSTRKTLRCCRQNLWRSTPS